VISRESTLEDVCFQVGAALDAFGISAVLTGGRAAAVHSGGTYVSLDADFVVSGETDAAALAGALAELGFHRTATGGMFEHRESPFTVDFPKGPLAVGAEYVRDITTLERDAMRLRILTVTDCIRDRLANFYFWDDYSALQAAVQVARRRRGLTDLPELRRWTERESGASGVAYLLKFEDFLSRLNGG
jgi:hypothetical protein